MELVGGVKLLILMFLQAAVWSHSGGSGKEDTDDDDDVIDEDISPEHAQWMKQVRQLLLVFFCKAEP